LSEPDAIVVGAGITGLTCAYRLQKLGVDTLVLERGDRIGGVIRTERINGYLVESGPSSLLPTPHTYDFLQELGLDTELLEANPKSPRYIVVDGRLRAIPLGPLTFGGMMRAVAEPLIRSKSQGDESIASFFRRRFGAQIHDRLAAPFVTGIFAGDTEKLSVSSVFPRLVEVERDRGSVILGMLRGKRGTSNETKTRRPRRPVISSFPNGLETLPRSIGENLKIQTQCSGIRIGKDVRARATILAVPAYGASEVLKETYPQLATLLADIEYAPIVVAMTSVPLSNLSAPLSGFGFLAPRSERMVTLGTIFNSLLFPDRSPDDSLLFTSYLGGAIRPEVFDWPDERVWESVCSELKRVLKTSTQPEPVAIFRHRRAIPQYNIGHRERVEALALELARLPGLFVTGSFLHGVSIPACMEHGDNTAVAVSEFLRNAS
jgi:oxygen-dependent protoporphyrinogen oxidase